MDGRKLLVSGSSRVYKLELTVLKACAAKVERVKGA